MSRAPAYALGAAALAAAMVIPLAPASAAPPSVEWSNGAPSIYMVDGRWSTDGVVSTTDRTPSLAVDSDQAGHVGATLLVRDRTTKKVLCTGTKSVVDLDPFYFARCTLDRLPIGSTVVEAVYVSSDGTQMTAPSAAVEVVIVPQRFDLDVTAYDRATGAVALSGTGVPGTSMEVGQGHEDTTFSGVHRTVDVGPDGRFETSLEEVADKGFTSIYEVGDDIWSAGAQFSVNAPLRPRATANVDGSRLVVDVASEEGERIVLRDQSYNIVASAPRDGAVTRLMVRAPAVESMFFASAASRSVGEKEYFSPDDDFIVKAGVGTKLEAAPQVSDVALAGRRVVATAQAEPGAQVTVKDDRGAVIGTRMAGASGVLQLALPAPAGTKAGSQFFIEQAKDGQVSEHDDFEIPID